ncbi:hypothetical protein PC129_g2523 [Phytophthora cactorum]|uniref:Uncharacterized protein n=1 Tax=Phytophthora cactorum TaxID=29920 RepID=A0A8T1E881_9STRA|nr:hypothetical protein PC112_g4245 [Phytophthora cactorum]KAG2841168.1 hypothetical protein PC111_g3221 [Phytophthora cactorum]KAG2864936.1 hypothetical protein PC113_g4141 [Phytophthora cactorum]KAG2924165.1 hypothetical protein PC114_g4617 [Phytophthora cactorum]KAG2950672.1 hypothetical protein PC117_g4274 [Phytophthora cactorum]
MWLAQNGTCRKWINRGGVSRFIITRWGWPHARRRQPCRCRSFHSPRPSTLTRSFYSGRYAITVTTTS